MTSLPIDLPPSPCIQAANAKRAAEGLRREQLLSRYREMCQSGLTGVEAAAKVGLSVTTIWRWQKALDHGGSAELVPKTGTCGSKPLLKTLNVTPGIINEVRRLNFELKSNSRAWRTFARSEKCPKALADVILNQSSRFSIPPSLAAATRLNKARLTAYFRDDFFAVASTTKPTG